MNDNNIANNIDKVLSSIREAEKKAGREKNSVKLLAVSKFHSIESINLAIEAGQIMFGENRIQEAYKKFSEINKKNSFVELHIIGNIQSNKIMRAVNICSCIESIDRLSLIKDIENACAKINKTIEILFEYHTGEDTKKGFKTYESLYEAVEFCSSGKAPHIIPRGFMTMAPFTQDEKLIRKSFTTMRDVSEKLKKEFLSLDLSILSMGMSNDYKVAIEEGSTEVRIGTAIFGERGV